MAALAMTVAACASHRVVEVPPADLAGRTVTLVLIDGSSVRARGEATPVGLAWHSGDGRIFWADQVSTIFVGERAQGAIPGMFAGGGLGLLCGAGIGYSKGDDECSGFVDIYCFTARQKAAYGGVLGALIGGGLAAVIGGNVAVERIDLRPRRQGASGAVTWRW